MRHIKTTSNCVGQRIFILYWFDRSGLIRKNCFRSSWAEAASLNNKIPNLRISIVLTWENKVKGFQIETSSFVISFEISHKVITRQNQTELVWVIAGIPKVDRCQNVYGPRNLMNVCSYWPVLQHQSINQFMHKKHKGKSEI